MIAAFSIKVKKKKKKIKKSLVSKTKSCFVILPSAGQHRDLLTFLFCSEYFVGNYINQKWEQKPRLT